MKKWLKSASVQLEADDEQKDSPKNDQEKSLKSKSVPLEADAEQKDSLNGMEKSLKSESV
jgi:hypothetical protein